VIGLAVVAPLAAAGCGSSSPAAVAPVSTPATHTDANLPPGVPTTTQLKRVLLRRNDVPARWTSKPASSDDPGSAKDQRRMAHCVGAGNTAPDQLADVDSQSFTLGQAQVSSSADSYRHHSDIKTDTALLRSPKAAGCFRRVFRSGIGGTLPAGAQVRRITVHITRRTRHQPRNVVGTIAGSMQMAAGGQVLTMHFTETAIVGRLTEAEVLTFSIGRGVPAALLKRLVAVVARRAAHL
jgi:hypothetical protein